MKTLKDIKLRMYPGRRFLCVENTYRPELNNVERQCVHVQGNAFTWVPVSDPTAKRSWSYWPKAKGIEYIDNDTVKLPLWDAYGEDTRHFLTLRFLGGSQS